MHVRRNLFVAAVLSIISMAAHAAAAPDSRITILYDAFGTDSTMQKDWGFSALVEIAGKRILFDTGDNAEIFAANVKAKGVDLTNLDFVVLSHRHSDLRRCADCGRRRGALRPALGARADCP